MAVYTDINEVELGDLLADYDVGTLMSYKGIAEGTENSNFVMHTSTGTFILTLYERRVKADDLPYFLGVMEHLARKGVACPLPVARRDGELISTIAGRSAAIITFLEGMWIRRPAPVHCRAVGAALARMHLAGADYPGRRENALSLKGWNELWSQCRERAHEVEPDLAEEVERDLGELAANWPRGLPTGIIHADLFPDNVFFLGEELSGLIDFYFACNDLYAYDVATCLNAWCFEKDHSFNLTKGTALLAGYQEVRPMGAAEIDMLPLLARGSALRFMLTRLYDWLTVKESALVQRRDPVEYIRKLRFHRRIISGTEYGARR